MRARLVVESGRWEEMKGQGSFDNVDELFALGISSARLGDVARAEAALDHLQNATKAAPDATNRQLAEIMAGEVAALIHLARGQGAEATAAAARAAMLESGMPRPIARPYPIKPAGELYAEVLTDTGDPAAAVRQFRAALERTPRRAACLIGLVRAAHRAGLHEEAAQAAREFLGMWHAADADRPELRDAQALVR